MNRPIEPRISIQTNNPAMSAATSRRVHNSAGKWMLTIDDGGPMICGEAITSPQEAVEHANKFFVFKTNIKTTQEIQEELSINTVLASIFFAAVEIGVHPALAYRAAKRALENFDASGIIVIP